MKTKSVLAAVLMCTMTAVLVMSVTNVASADSIRGIEIGFVNIVHAGNPGDIRPEANPYGCGAVGYNYRIGKYEVTNTQWNAFITAAGAPNGNPTTAYGGDSQYIGAQQPTNAVSWYESLQFCNYLTSGDKSKGAYLFNGNNTNAGDFLGIDRTAAIVIYGTVYVIPTEDEWYKAAYYKPGGSGYSLFANGLDIIPTADNGWNYAGGSYDVPWNVGNGTQEQNGTFDMMGNVWEWNEAERGTIRCVRGGAFYAGTDDLSASNWGDLDSDDEGGYVGFRVVSVPEPCTLLLLGLGAAIAVRKQTRSKATSPLRQ